MYECKSWTIKKSEHQKTDAFELQCWGRLLRFPWTARRSNQSILKEINLNIHWKDRCWSWSWSSHLMWRADSLEKTLILGKIEDKRRSGWQRMRQLDSVTDSMDMNLSKLWEIVDDRGAWRTAVHGVSKSQTWFTHWTTTIREGKKALIRLSLASVILKIRLWVVIAKSFWNWKKGYMALSLPLGAAMKPASWLHPGPPFRSHQFPALSFLSRRMF